MLRLHVRLLHDLDEVLDTPCTGGNDDLDVGL